LHSFASTGVLRLGEASAIGPCEGVLHIYGSVCIGGPDNVGTGTMQEKQKLGGGHHTLVLTILVGELGIDFLAVELVRLALTGREGGYEERLTQ
jgi:hypothetical protein